MAQLNRVRSFEELEVHKAAHTLAVHVYRATASFPSDDRYAMTSQVRRSALSVPSNIAEGWGRGQGKANANHVRIARGSLAELQSLLAIAGDLDLLDVDSRLVFTEEIRSSRRLIDGYLRSIEENVVHEEPTIYRSTEHQTPDP